MKLTQKKNKEAQKQCGVCAAGFEIWLNNLKFDEEKQEKLSEHFLQYCPACGKVGEK